MLRVTQRSTHELVEFECARCIGIHWKRFNARRSVLAFLQLAMATSTPTSLHCRSATRLVSRM
jgi:hypothetical protein